MNSGTTEKVLNGEGLYELARLAKQQIDERVKIVATLPTNAQEGELYAVVNGFNFTGNS